MVKINAQTLKRDNSINNVVRKPFIVSTDSNALHLANINSELHHQRERNHAQQQNNHYNQNVVKTEYAPDSMVTIGFGGSGSGTNVMVGCYDGDLGDSSSLIKLDGNDWSINEIFRDNFKFSSPQDITHPAALKMYSDLSKNQELYSYGISRDPSIFSPVAGHHGHFQGEQLYTS